MQRIAIIGGGPAGVSAALELLRIRGSSSSSSSTAAPLYAPTLFERRRAPGGVWTYEEPQAQRICFDETGQAHAVARTMDGAWPPAGMFEGLRTNIPSDLMTFRDAPFAPSTPLFPSRRQVLDYLHAYAEQHRELLAPVTRFGTEVVGMQKQGSTWSVTSRQGQDERQEVFDKVVIATGRCARPQLPFVPGLWHFAGEIWHSSWYRTPLVFRNKTVLVVGNASSGMDIARELSGYSLRPLPAGPLSGDEVSAAAWAEESAAGRTGIRVLQSVEDVEKPPPMDYDPRDPASPDWARRIRVVPRIKSVDAEAIELADGERLTDVDAIIFATGFVAEFPFLPPVAPFDLAPLLPAAPERPPLHDDKLGARLEKQGGPYRAPPAAPVLNNLDDWLLFYEKDDSVAVLGAPTTVVPFHLSQAQARYVAAYWAGKAAPLPQLDSSIPPTEAARWSSTRQADQTETWPQGRCAHVFGNPSDAAYVDELLARSPEGGAEAPWDVEYRAQSDGRGGGPRGQEDWSKTPTWRRERRNKGKELRREELGY